MDGFEVLTKAMNRCAASLKQLANAIRQSETQRDYIKRKNNRPTYRKGERLHDGLRSGTGSAVQGGQLDTLHPAGQSSGRGAVGGAEPLAAVAASLFGLSPDS